MPQFQHGVVGDENCMSTTDVGYYYVHYVQAKKNKIQIRNKGLNNLTK